MHCICRQVLVSAVDHRGQKRAVDAPGTGVTGGWEWRESWEQNSGSLQEQQMMNH